MGFVEQAITSLHVKLNLDYYSYFVGIVLSVWYQAA